MALFAFDISSTFKKLILNSYLWVKSTRILAKSIFLGDAIHICLTSRNAKLDHLLCCYGLNATPCFVICSDAMLFDALRWRFCELALNFFHMANFDYEVGRIKRFDFF